MFKIEGKTLNDLILKDIKYNFEDISEIDRQKPSIDKETQE